MHDTTPSQTVSTLFSWARPDEERLRDEAGASLREEAGGAFGDAPREDRARLQAVLASTARPGLTVDDDLTGGLWPRWGQTRLFVRYPGRTAAESIRLAAGLLWSHVDDAVFRFRRGDDLDARVSLARALCGLEDSFSRAHVKRARIETGAWVIKDVFDPGLQAEDEADEAEPDDSSETRDASILATQLLLSYFVQRVLGLASEAGQVREALESGFLREEAS